MDTQIAHSNFYLDVTWSCPPLKVSERRIYPSATFEKLTIGSGEENDIVLVSRLVSSSHACINKRNGYFFLEDAGSKNGILFSGEIYRQPRLIEFEVEFEIRPFTFNITLIPAPLRYTVAWKNSENGEKVQVIGLELPITVGRDPTNNLVLPDKKVSRYHAYIEMDNHHLRLLDKASNNGSFVNGAKNQQSTLGLADNIQIGPYTIHVSPFIPESHKKTQ